MSHSYTKRFAGEYDKTLKQIHNLRLTLYNWTSIIDKLCHDSISNYK